MNHRAVLIGIGLAALGTAAWASFGVRPPVDNPDGPLADVTGTLADWGSSVIGGNSQGMAFSAEGLARLKSFEGFAATPYADFKGSSIGYGHLIKPGEDLTYVTEPQAASLLAQDVAWAVDAVNTGCVVSIDQNQFDALVSFTYNVGKGAFLGSTLLRMLNAGDIDGAAAQFDRWNRAGGEVNQALVARRAAERELFES